MPHTISAGSCRLRSTVVSLLAVSTLVGAIACSSGDSSTGPADTNPVGRYTLAQIDKRAIPFEVFHGRFYDPDLDYTYNRLVINVTDGEITLGEGGALHLVVHFVVTEDDDVYGETWEVDGTYQVTGARIHIDTPDGSGGGDIGDGTVTFNLDVGRTNTMRTYTFRKR